MTKNYKLLLTLLLTSVICIFLINSSLNDKVEYENNKAVQTKISSSHYGNLNNIFNTNVFEKYYHLENNSILLNHKLNNLQSFGKLGIYLYNLQLSKYIYNHLGAKNCITNYTNQAFVVNFPIYSSFGFLIIGDNLFSSIPNKWIIGFIVLLAIGIIMFFYFTKNSTIHHYSHRNYIEQKRYIDAERQRISSEMHDEIGAGLSAIKLFSEVASKNRKDVDEIRQINVMINEMADKINEIIWSTNAESDNLESLFDFIEGQSRKLFEHSSITFTASMPHNIPDVIISSQIRRNNYLLIKEVVHNALKHSKGTTVHLGISISNGLVIYSIKDNGVGFDPNLVKLNAMGLSNIKLRIERLKGSLIIENYKGTGILIKIPLEGMIMKFEKKKFGWIFPEKQTRR
ncbi:sensor histidine kinase [Pedobacter jamesrossensis]|uniref:histidine kinase n=1 Tax=Pedobacter jamesrossensis TaxID=1908238 RepID=A0ABV8NPT4_9SPHI